MVSNQLLASHNPGFEEQIFDESGVSHAFLVVLFEVEHVSVIDYSFTNQSFNLVPPNVGEKD